MRANLETSSCLKEEVYSLIYQFHLGSRKPAAREDSIPQVSCSNMQVLRLQIDIFLQCTVDFVMNITYQTYTGLFYHARYRNEQSERLSIAS